MNFQNNDDHFIISQELIMVMQRIIEQYSDELKEIMKKAMAQHHFDNPDNFCLENNRIKFLDYGDCEVREVVLEIRKR